MGQIGGGDAAVKIIFSLLCCIKSRAIGHTANSTVVVLAGLS